MKHKFAIFGTGSMARIYAELIRQRPDVELVGVVGNTPERTAEFASVFGIAGYPQSQYSRMLGEHPEVDAVIIATPESVRAKPLEAAVNSARNILLEKPFADSWKDSQRYYSLLKDYTKIFQICHVLRHSPRFSALRQSVLDGEVGSVRHIYARRNSNNVRARRVLGKTDLAFWLASHDIDMIRWVTGKEIQQVYALSRQKLMSADDYLIANLRFGDGAEAIDAVLEISWCGPPVSPTARDAVFEVRGSRGHVELEDFAMNVKVFGENSVVKAPDTYEDYSLHGRKDGFFRAMMDDFVRSLDNGHDSAGALRDALEASRACAMIRKSLDESRIVQRAEFA